MLLSVDVHDNRVIYSKQCVYNYVVSMLISPSTSSSGCCGCSASSIADKSVSMFGDTTNRRLISPSTHRRFSAGSR